MATYCVIGRGMLGTALSKKLDSVSFYPTEDTKYMFYFDSVVHMDYEKNPEYHFNKVVMDFVFLLPYCEKHNIKFIYASSALVYEKDTDFAKCKRTLETMALEHKNTLGLRIFPVYGSGSHAVISKWCESISKDLSPIVWGDGEQKRDFIYIDDFVNQVIEAKDKTGIIDIGTGSGISFNKIIEIINEVLDKDIKPIYIDAPQGYSKGIFCQEPLKINTSIFEGITKICEQL